MRTILFAVIVLFTASCKQKTYCYNCEAKAFINGQLQNMNHYTYCDKTEDEINDLVRGSTFENGQSSQGQWSQTMTCNKQ